MSTQPPLSANLRAISQALHEFGGFLRCETCGVRRDMRKGDNERFLFNGWPKHCGYTMRWWTARQIAAGDVPVSVLGADTPRDAK